MTRSELRSTLFYWVFWPILFMGNGVLILLQSPRPGLDLVGYAFAAATGIIVTMGLFRMAWRVVKARLEKREVVQRITLGVAWTLVALAVAVQFLADDPLSVLAMGTAVGIGACVCWPRPRDFLDSLVNDLRDKERIKTALVIARLYAKLRPGNPFGWYVLAEASRPTVDPGQVSRILESGLKRNPESRGLREYYVLELIRVGRYEQAEAEIARIPRKSGEPGSEMLLADLAMNRRQWTEVRNLCAKALESRDLTEIYERLKIALILSTAPNETQAARRIVEDTPGYWDDPDCLVWLAVWSEDDLTRQELTQRARQVWRRRGVTVEDQIKRARDSWLDKRVGA